MKKKKKSSRVFGSRTKEEAAKEAEFKEQLNVFFPDITINFVYHDIKIGGKVSQKIKDEGCFGYHMRESILVDNEVGEDPKKRKMKCKQKKERAYFLRGREELFIVWIVSTAFADFSMVSPVELKNIILALA